MPKKNKSQSTKALENKLEKLLFDAKKTAFELQKRYTSEFNECEKKITDVQVNSHNEHDYLISGQLDGHRANIGAWDQTNSNASTQGESGFDLLRGYLDNGNSKFGKIKKDHDYVKYIAKMYEEESNE